MKLFLTQFFLFLFLNISYSQVIFIHNTNEWELWDAIYYANNGDTIMFDLPSYPAIINISSGFMIDKNISIFGSQNQSVSLVASSSQFSNSQLFYINNNVNVELKNLTLTREIGGVNNNGQSLIWNSGTLRINNCLMHNIIDSMTQGAVILNSGNLFLKNSTLSENYGSQGGAIYSTGNLDIVSCTFYENHAESGGGGIYWHDGFGGNLSCSNSIFFNSPCDRGKVINSLGYNISNDGSYGFNSCTDLNNLSSIFLNQLQNNGGPTYTHSLGYCSIAINNGNPNITENDQRGLPVYGGNKDIGAYEAQTDLNSIHKHNDIRTELSPFTWINGDTYTSDNNCSSHILVGQGVNGCDSLVTLDLTITINEHLQYTLTANDNSACAGTTLTLSVNIGPSYSPGTVHCLATSTAVIEVTNPATGKTWMDRNLGATQVATSITDAAAYGDLYQWGRRSGGHQCRNSVTTTTLSSNGSPAQGSFILTSTIPNDWRSPQNDNLWQGVNGVHNPCPSGYRLPTETELNEERLSWSSNNTAGAFNSTLKLPLAGLRYFHNAAISGVGSQGLYWSSTVSSAGSRFLLFHSSNANMSTYARAVGFSVRCIKD